MKPERSLYTLHLTPREQEIMLHVRDTGLMARTSTDAIGKEMFQVLRNMRLASRDGTLKLYDRHTFVIGPTKEAVMQHNKWEKIKFEFGEKSVEFCLTNPIGMTLTCVYVAFGILCYSLQGACVGKRSEGIQLEG